jgi:hypothetical protein
MNSTWLRFAGMDKISRETLGEKHQVLHCYSLKDMQRRSIYKFRMFWEWKSTFECEIRVYVCFFMRFIHSIMLARKIYLPSWEVPMAAGRHLFLHRFLTNLPLLSFLLSEQARAMFPELPQPKHKVLERYLSLSSLDSLCEFCMAFIGTG